MPVGLILAALAFGAAFFAAPYVLDRKFNAVKGPKGSPSSRAREILATASAVDLHADSLLWNRDLLVRHRHGHVDVPRLIEGRVAVQAFTIVTKVPVGVNIERNTDESDHIAWLSVMQRWPSSTWGSLKERALFQAAKLQSFAAKSDGKLTLIRSASDLRSYLQRRASDTQCTAGFLGIEGAHCLEGDLTNIDVFFEHGIRMMAPVHFFDNDLGGSAHGTVKGGLTDKGKAMISRMQELSMIVDLAHSSPALIEDVLAIAEKPVVVSHTGVRGTCDNSRNLSDADLRGIAKTGGVVGIGYWSDAVGSGGVNAIARAIRYTADLIGVQHVALGSDFDGVVSAPFDTTGLVDLIEALLQQNFSEAEIRLILGENALRVLLETLPA